MSYLDNEDSLKSKITSNRYVSMILEWWYYYSAFVIVPLGLIIFFGAAYFMFRDVL